MAQDYPRSTLFFSERLSVRENPKDAQELAVAATFAKYFAESAGHPLENGRRPKGEPPDLLFDWNGSLVGAELFEVPSFYYERSWLKEFTNVAYRRFALAPSEDRYLGVAISLVVSIRIGLRARVEKEWSDAGIRQPLDKAADQLVQLVNYAVAGRESLPDSDFGVTLAVDRTRFTALAILTSQINYRKCPIDNPRRSDGRAAPVVLAGGVYDYNDAEMIASAERTLSSKMDARRRWQEVDRAILVAHDYPRVQMWEGLPFEWPGWLSLAARRVGTLSVFDEFWLITVRTELGEAFRVGPQSTLAFGGAQPSTLEF